jgi:5-(carboxyamino)imidazole ribonucleotide synthase
LLSFWFSFHPMRDTEVFLPGSTIGVMGGGQLGRMFAVAARRMGYRIHTFSPEEDSPTGQLADREVAAAFDDEEAVRDFAKHVDVLTFEFENIPAQSIAWAASECVVRPSGDILHICQNRLREKEFLTRAGIPSVPFAPVSTAAELASAIEQIGLPAVLKTAAFGYDGKGQRRIDDASDADEAWTACGAQPSVLEGWIEFEKEISVIIARGSDAATSTFSVCENMHTRHILDVTVVPARITRAVAEDAREIAERIAAGLNLVGVLAVEMFLRTDGTLLVNELAPRPHNSGHFSFDACVTSQFEQQLRAVCGLPLGSSRLLRPVAMANLLGDLWSAGEPDWRAAAAFPFVKLHLYGKTQPKPGRKMGHLIGFGEDVEEALAMVRAARSALVPQ